MRVSASARCRVPHEFLPVNPLHPGQKCLCHIGSKSWKICFVLRATHRTHGVTDPHRRQVLRAEIDAFVARRFGLTEAEFTHIFGTFPLVDLATKQLTLEPTATSSTSANSLYPANDPHCTQSTNPTVGRWTRWCSTCWGLQQATARRSMRRRSRWCVPAGKKPKASERVFFPNISNLNFLQSVLL